MGYFVLDDSEKHRYYPWTKISNTELVEIRPAKISNHQAHNPDLPTYIQIGSVYWANSSGETSVAGIAGDYCFIDGIAWMPSNKEAAELVSTYKKQSWKYQIGLSLSGYHLNNAPDWYQE